MSVCVRVWVRVQIPTQTPAGAARAIVHPQAALSTFSGPLQESRP